MLTFCLLFGVKILIFSLETEGKNGLYFVCSKLYLL